jgi:predicted permease
LKYSAPRIRNFYDAAAQRLRQLPEVANVSTSDTAPLRGSFRRTVFSSDVDTTDPSNGRLAGIISVSPGFFATTGMRLVAGRDFDEHDDANGALVVIANQAAAQSIWRGADPLGKQVRLLLQSPNVTVVGLVNTVTYQGIGESPQPILYVPLKQRPSAQGFLYVRTRGAPSASVASIRTAVMSVEPNLPLLRVVLGEDLRRDLLALRRIGAQSLLVFGGLALVLASLGTYGVMSYAIERRRREIAIRMAIGSSKGVLLRQILTNCLLTIGMGVVAGMLVAVPAAGVIGALLYGIGAFDLVAVGGSVAVLFGASLLACALPAWRAMHVEPRAALYPE